MKELSQQDLIKIIAIIAIVILIVLLTGCTYPVIVEDSGFMSGNCSKSYDLYINNQSASRGEIGTYYWYDYHCSNNTIAYKVRHVENTTFELRVK